MVGSDVASNLTHGFCKSSMPSGGVDLGLGL